MVLRRLSLFITILFIMTNLVVFQNCGTPSENGGLNIGSTGGTTPTSGTKCGVGKYRPNSSGGCTSVGDEYYSPANDDKRYSCPAGALTKDTPRGAKTDCKPYSVYSTTPGNCDLNAGMTTFASSQPVYGCIRGAVEETEMVDPKVIACSSTDGLVTCGPRQAANIVTLPNGDWTWDPNQKAFVSRNLRAWLGNGVTFYNYVKRSDGAESPELIVQTLP